MTATVLTAVLIRALKGSPTPPPRPAQPARWKLVLWCTGLVLSAPAIRAIGALIATLTHHGS